MKRTIWLAIGLAVTATVLVAGRCSFGVKGNALSRNKVEVQN